jgi:hypothetical protein
MNSSWKGVCLSGLVYPGLGQIVQKHYLRGISLIGIFTACLFVIVFTAIKQYETILTNIESSSHEHDMAALIREASKFTVSQDSSTMKYASAVILCCWAIGTVDAYLSGKKIDLRKGSPNP